MRTMFVGMNRILPAILALTMMGFATQSSATDPTLPVEDMEEQVILEAADVDLDAFRWIKRPVVVFADSPADPAYVQQMQLLTRELDAVKDRDIIIITDTDPAAQTALRTKLRPRGFMLALIGKDGQVKLRKPLPWSVRELSRTIDKMPMRQQEIRDRRGDGL